MKIKNQSGGFIFWRAFKGDDTSYMSGVAEGFLGKGETGLWRDDSFSEIKVEIKEGFLPSSNPLLALGQLAAARQFVRPGRKFKMTDDLVFDGTNLEVAKITVEGLTNTRSVTLKDVQFFDARNWNQDSNPREITSTLQNTLTTSQGLQLSHQHAQTWTAGGKLGGTLGNKDEWGGSGEVSLQFKDVVTDYLQNTYTQQVSSVWSKTIKDTINFKRGFLYAVEVIWSVTLEEGFISYFGEKSSYSVVKNADSSLTRPSVFKSEDEMPEDLRIKYNSLNSTKSP